MTDWPHSPPHRLDQQGPYIVTAATYHKLHLFGSAHRLDFLQYHLTTVAPQFGWQLEAWAVFSNHYHFVAQSPMDPHTLDDFLEKLHTDTATHINQLDDMPGRQVWYRFWETYLSYQRSYMARLNYVLNNAVHHGLVTSAAFYRWCSAAHFEQTARPAYQKTVRKLRTDQVKVLDDFEPVGPGQDL